jgi:very-short-patch-repair endonuclease
MKASDYRAAASAGSSLEDELARQLDLEGITYERQVKVIEGRKFAWDFLVAGMILLEVDGGIYVQGRHTRGAGYTKDCEKTALAVIEGWRVMRVTSDQVESGEACQWIKKAIERTLRRRASGREAAA